MTIWQHKQKHPSIGCSESKFVASNLQEYRLKIYTLSYLGFMYIYGSDSLGSEPKPIELTVSIANIFKFYWLAAYIIFMPAYYFSLKCIDLKYLLLSKFLLK